MELWSGKAPFRRSTAEAIDQAMLAPHPRPSEADPRLLPLDAVMTAAMALDPRVRPQQADDLSRALRKFLSGIDLGDVARKLGDRVRRLRESPLPPATQRKPILQRPPSRPSATDLGTKTFAAREEVGAWEPSQGTRKVISEAPPPKPRMPEIETIATRPIETPARDQKTASVEAPKRSLAGVGAGVAVAGAVAVAAFFLGRGAALGPTATAPPSATTATVAPSVTVPAPPATTAAIASAHVAPLPVPTTTGSIALERATLVLVGDGTSVSVDGVGRGTAPLKVAVEPGTHAVSFRFAATGEAKGASVTVKPGERATLRADFTGASPSVRVER